MSDDRSPRGRGNPAAGRPVRYGRDGRLAEPAAGAAFTPVDPGPGSGRPRPAYRVDGDARLVVEEAVLRWEEIAATWEPREARTLWESAAARAERGRMYRDTGGWETPIARRMAAAKALMLEKCARDDGSAGKAAPGSP